MIQAYIITGFLGVGKSSLLTNTIRNYFGEKKIALIVNEFGEIGVDQNILKNVHSDVIEISEGCICCAMAEEFENGVIEIINKYNPDLIFVETSGATEPFPIYMSLQNLGIGVDGALCVVDVKNYKSYMDNPTARYQIGGSNIIVLNKTDLVNEQELAIATEDIKAFKEEHNIKNMLTGESVFNNYVIHKSEHGVLPQEIFEGSYSITEILHLVEVAQHEHHHELTERSAATLSKNILFNDVDQLFKALPKNIYRVKGMIKVEDVPVTLIANYAFGNVTYEELNEYKGENILVFIGQDIDEEIKKLADNFSFCDFHLHQHEHHEHDHDHHHEHTHH